MHDSMPKAKTSTFIEAQQVDIVLVPLDDLAVLHGGRLDRHEFVQAVVGQHETAWMLGKVARRIDELASQFQGQRQPSVAEV